MSTLTISVEDAVEKKFRTEVQEHLGTAKGVLGQAITEAMQLWIMQKTQEDIALQLKEALERGYEMGRPLYNRREELHARK